MPNIYFCRLFLNFLSHFADFIIIIIIISDPIFYFFLISHRPTLALSCTVALNKKKSRSKVFFWKACCYLNWLLDSLYTFTVVSLLDVAFSLLWHFILFACPSFTRIYTWYEHAKVRCLENYELPFFHFIKRNRKKKLLDSIP